MRREQTVHLERLHTNMLELPWYIQEFIDTKEDTASPSTLLGYVHEYKHFLQWLMAEGIAPYEKLADIPYSILEQLRRKDVENYIKHLSRRKKINSDKDLIQNQKLSNSTILRSVSALKSLFHYLTTMTEDNEGESYFYRNVMAKVEIKKDKETINARANRMRAKILHNDDDRKLLEFVATEYENLVARTKKEAYFKRDKERDLAILSLFLGSGMRVGELADLQLEKINVNERIVTIIRKGGKEDSIWITPSALTDLQEYLKIRKERYKTSDDEQAVFLTLHNGSYKPMSVRAIQNMVDKYTKAFNVRLTPHKLRHTFATNFYNKEKDALQVMMQLGHSSTDTTVLYTQLGNATLKESLERLDE
ncbi:MULTISPECIES: tyrosine recombinase XerS [Peribacillus]|uniref:tyrosine recombinase XerS n=1 Tax=Peribacillus TaxID=2675229 RepID=UPI000BA67F2C|nr:MULTISPECIES: tyrosine recombinase XerS [Peribacillus]MCM3169547.1 tyrosine recombinase XerS [Peribacillus frigoritolerans]PAL08041.1 tyrosine recombinase XerS [Peribacillus simplex]